MSWGNMSLILESQVFPVIPLTPIGSSQEIKAIDHTHVPRDWGWVREFFSAIAIIIVMCN